MFGLNMTAILVILLVAVSLGTATYAILYARIETERKSEGRVKRVKAADAERANVKAARDRVSEMSKRRKTVQDSLKELEKRQQEKHKKALSLKSRIAQTGTTITIAQFYIASVVFGLIAFLAAVVLGASLMIAGAVAFVAAIGLPRWVIGFLIKRRKNKFLDEFPNALDVMVRSIKSGLPLSDALRLIASDSQEPVRTEFRRVVEAQQVGLSVPEATARMYTNLPLQELNFFSIVITIQSQAGGNLSEALANLSKVLRERRKMKQKVAAVSMEAKSSAAIIGSLPFIVAILVHLTSPEYLAILFTDPRGHFILGGSAIWMSMGIFVMKNMVNFEI